MVPESDKEISHAGRRLLQRRHFLAHTATGLGGIALAHLLSRDGLLGAATEKGPLRPKVDQGR